MAWTLLAAVHLIFIYLLSFNPGIILIISIEIQLITLEDRLFHSLGSSNCWEKSSLHGKQVDDYDMN